MAKIFTFRGKTLEDLQKLSLDEFAKLCPARTRRSLSRGVDKALMKKVDKAIELKKSGKYPKPIRTHKREAVVMPKMVGLLFGVYKGSSFETVEIKPEMLGHYLGEFCLTRKRVSHGKAGIGATRSSTALVSARG